MGHSSRTIFLIAAATSVASAAPAPGSELAIADLRWPDGTDAATVRSSTRVVDTIRGKRIGTIAGGTRVTWKKIVASSGDACRAWVALEPRGWVCATSLLPGTKPPPASRTPAPVTAPPSRDKFAAIRPDGADAYATLDDLKAGTSRRVPYHTYVSIRANAMWQKHGGQPYVFTDQGWIATKDLWWHEASPFSGIELPTNTALSELGWAVARKVGGKIAVRATPDPKGMLVRELAPRDRVTIVEDREGWTRIGVDQWVDAGELRRVTKRSRPDGVGSTERWIDVDLDHQTLVAYDGEQPVFATLVSTGKIKWDTPHGIFRITGKDERARMRDSRDPDDSWDVADVPWSIRYMKNFALHGTYWHDGFGRRKSHGCVNLSTSDAKRIYNWVTPDSPPGWTNVENVDGTGTVVRIFSARNRDPRWYDYEGNPLKTIATK